MKNVLGKLFGARAALVYLILFAAAIGVATFVENDFGTATSQAIIYQSFWFELLLALFSGALMYNVVQYRLLQRKQYATLLFHASILIILLGSAITRNYGWEGMLHVREGSSSNEVLSRDTYLTVEVSAGDEQYRSTEQLFASSFGNGTSFHKTYKSRLGDYSIECIQTLVEPATVLTSDGGDGAIQVVFGGANGRTELVLTPNDPVIYENVGLFWDANSPDLSKPFKVRKGVNGLEIASIYAISRRIMASGQQDTLEAGSWHPLLFRALHSSRAGQFVFSNYEEDGHFSLSSTTRKITSSSTIGLVFAIEGEDFSDTVMVQGAQGWLGQPVVVKDGDVQVALSFGSIKRSLPFSIALDDFQMTRYPGTDAAATFASQVRVLDPQANDELEYNIHMNHILDYGGYRFFQSSYDQDERGSYLSVNHDFYGTWVTYLGYFLLTVGMIWALFASKTRFALLRKRVRGVGATLLILATIGWPLHGHAQSSSSLLQTAVSKEHAAKLSKLYVQDFRGRMKPVHTLSREILRKLSSKESVEGLTADQFLLSAALNPASWYTVPMIKQGQSPVVQKALGTTEKYISYDQCFDEQGQYKLRELVGQAQNKKPTDKDANDKTVIALDERINIMNMVFSGQFLKMVPLEGDENNTWSAPRAHGQQSNPNASKFFTAYFSALEHGMKDGHYSQADAYLAQLADYQHEISSDLLPSDTQRSMEIWMNELRPFDRLAGVYGLLAVVFLVLLFLEVFMNTSSWPSKVKVYLWLVAYVPFIIHTLALGARWYISERAPWSNGYESLIYIAWTSALSGLLFSKKEYGALAATNILSATVLLIAMLSYLNPEITPLVPVLKSYWLTIHVSLEAGSYGFLMLGAIIGLIILLLYIVRTPNNTSQIQSKIDRLHAIAELTITGGLYMLSIGTYLGGIWANESWGRYWGWDAKETWALVSILVYATILHMRFIPKFNNAFSFSVGTLIGLASVVMTYFGVNYYLSGLHSYAAGDPVPVPMWVYYTSITFIIVSIVAWNRKVAFKR